MYLCQRFFILFTFIILTAGCTAGAGMRTAGYYEGAHESLASTEADSFSSMDDGGVEVTQEKGNQSDTETRKRHYKGFMELSVKHVKDTSDHLIEYVESFQGFIEFQNDQELVFRVPVQHYQQVYDYCLSQGQVIRKSLVVKDLTNATADIATRIKIAESTLARLQELLAKTEDTEDRVKLLKQIQRLTEQLENLKGSLTTLNELAKFSQLTIRLTPRITETPKPLGGTQDFEGFNWIQKLSAFDRTVAAQGKPLKFDTPAEMVELEPDRNRGVWIAESANHASVWASQLDNYPQGDSEFWHLAITSRIAQSYQRSTSHQIGEYQFIRLTDHSETPYVYWVGVLAVDDKINLVEVYFPDQTVEKRYWPNIVKVIKEGKR